MTSDAGVVKELVNQRVRFPKPLQQYEAVKPFGPVLFPSFMSLFHVLTAA